MDINTLPNKASSLLLLALEDFEACEREPTLYRINMNYWYLRVFGTNGICEICLAGAVIAQRLALLLEKQDAAVGTIYTDESISLVPNRFPFELREKLLALDFLRKGQICKALYRLVQIFKETDWPDREIADYHDLPDLFKSQLRELAENLKEKGL